MFCKKCGKKIDDDSSFCPFCGTEVGRKTDLNSETNENKANESPLTGSNPEKKRKEFYEGDIHKCPNCGEIIKSFETKCPTCGFELRNTRASNAITEFSRKLEELESQRTTKTTKQVVAQSFADAFGVGHTEKIDKEIINLIRNFSIPNNKEDIIEFIILACSNIDVVVAAADNPSDAGCSGNRELQTLKQVNEAWVSKASQAYQKGKISFGHDRDFEEAERLYIGKTSIYKKSNFNRKRNRTLIIIGCIVFLVLDFAFIVLMAYLEKQGII